MLDEAFLIGILKQLVDLQLTKALDVDRAALLVYLVIEVRVDSLYLFSFLVDKVLINNKG